MTTTSLTKSMLMPSVFNDFFKPWNEWFNDGGLWDRVLTMPAVNVSEKKDHYLISVAAPGLSKSDFEISVEGNMMTISAEKEESSEEKDEQFTRKEYNYNSFSRSFTLPEEVKQDGIDANYENGLLTIRLPKTETAKKAGLHKSITVK